MRDIYHGSHEYGVKCYLYKRKDYPMKNDVLEAEEIGHIFYARYIGSMGQALTQAGGVMQYDSETFSVETLDKLEIEPNDFVIYCGKICVVETVTKRPKAVSTHYGSYSNSTIIALRR